jgi:hypothetical protein
VKKLKDNMRGLELQCRTYIWCLKQSNTRNQQVCTTNQEQLQELHVITNSVWEKLVDLFRDPLCDINHITSYFREIGLRYYIDPRTIIKQFLYYIVRHRSSEMVSVPLLNSIEHIIHLHHIRNEYIIHYFISSTEGSSIKYLNIKI